MPPKRSRVESLKAKPVRHVSPATTATSIPAAALSTTAKNESIEIQCHALMKVKDKSIAAADRLRKIQIKNINDMHDFEVEEANAKYKSAVVELRQTITSSPPPPSSSPTRGSAAASAKATVAPARSTRSKQKDNEDGDDATDKNNEKTVATAASSASTANKKRALANPTFQLSGKTLCSADCRSDFALILEDTKSRTADVTPALQPAVPISVTVKEHMDGNTLTIDYPNTEKPDKSDNMLTFVFSVGIPVSVYSAFTDETFEGTLTVISRTEVVIKLKCASRVRFFISQLRSERVKMKFKA